MLFCIFLFVRGLIVFFDKFIKVIRIGMISGKFKMVMRLVLLFVFVEIVEIKVKVIVKFKFFNFMGNRNGLVLIIVFLINKFSFF